MDPEVFRTPWKVVEDQLHGNVIYFIMDREGTSVAMLGNWDHAQLIVSRVNAYFEGL